MKMTKKWSLKCLFASLMLFGLTACSSVGIRGDGDVYQPHSFSFNVRQDMPDIEVLDYQYSNSRHNGIRAEPEVVNMGIPINAKALFGNLLRGDFLYVKWRVKKPGTMLPEYLGTYEDKVDLRSRLPADITGLKLHFIIRGPQLYVYLVWPYDEKLKYPSNKKSLFDRVKYIQVYPDQAK